MTLDGVWLRFVTYIQNHNLSTSDKCVDGQIHLNVVLKQSIGYFIDSGKQANTFL